MKDMQLVQRKFGKAITLEMQRVLRNEDTTGVVLLFETKDGTTGFVIHENIKNTESFVQELVSIVNNHTA